MRAGADDDGLAAELRAVALFDGREERIHVDVQDAEGAGDVGAHSFESNFRATRSPPASEKWRPSAGLR